MRIILLSCLVGLVGCGGSASSYVHSDTTLGRVVVYRNGVAYYERYANVDGQELKLSVPSDKVDDFLKSLTVVDAVTGQPAPVAYPTNLPSSAAGLIDMNIHLQGPMPHRLRLSYVTESPSWKPSYRLTVGGAGKVELQAWAIVDNTSGEDWNQVKLGVGSSSAMSFRFDLRSIRTVQRETLRPEDMFALAPPTGESTYDNDHDGIADLSDETINANEEAQKPAESKHYVVAQENNMRIQPARPMRASGGGSGHGAGGMGRGDSGAAYGSAAPPATTSAPEGKPKDAEAGRFDQVAQSLRGSSGPVTVEGFANPSDGDKLAASLERANKVREQLVRAGVDPNRVVAVGKGEQSGRTGGVRIVRGDNAKSPQQGADAAAAVQPGEPIGTSHFESGSSMNVPRGSSAMVSILKTQTDGDVVYLYDPESARGNAKYAFRAVRIRNPTDSQLETGPVTVFGEGKFIGEGMCEPIPARSMAFVPFALDRQIVVEEKDAEHDEIARILTVQRGVLSTEVQHTRKQTLTLHNRLSEKATVYVRHTLAEGYKLTKSPANVERMGNAHVFRVELAPNEKRDVDIEESTPVFKTADLRTPEGLDLVNVFVSSAAAEGPLKAAVADLLQVHRDMANLEQHIATTKEQMGEYRERMDELHVQIVTLRAVRTAGPLMQSLERKLSEMSDKLSKSTIDVVSLEEKLMVAKIHFQDKVADLTLEKPADSEAQAKK
jgi:hypothetical protein